MKDKQMHFNIGFFRCGNTLLRSIINQNPNFHMTPNSLTAEIFYRIDLIKMTDIFKELSDYEALRRIMKQIFNLYYGNLNQKYILEQGPWGTPDNFELLRYNNFYPKSKFICLIRPLKEIIASWVKQDNPQDIDNYVNQMMGEYGRIGNTMVCLDNLMLKSPRALKFIHYEDLCEKPEETVKKIYDHLEIPNFKHTFTNLDQPGTVSEMAKFPKQITIRTDKISKVEYDYDKYCPQRILERYGMVDEAIKRYCVKARSNIIAKK
jgi:sulfotransferase